MMRGTMPANATDREQLYEITCPHCARAYHLSPQRVEKYAGTLTRCKSCAEPFHMPRLPDGATPEQTPALLGSVQADDDQPPVEPEPAAGGFFVTSDDGEAEASPGDAQEVVLPWPIDPDPPQPRASSLASAPAAEEPSSNGTVAAAVQPDEPPATPLPTPTPEQLPTLKPEQPQTPAPPPPAVASAEVAELAARLAPMAADIRSIRRWVSFYGWLGLVMIAVALLPALIVVITTLLAGGSLLMREAEKPQSTTPQTVVEDAGAGFGGLNGDGMRLREDR
jgi:hypothetical protein